MDGQVEGATDRLVTAIAAFAEPLLADMGRQAKLSDEEFALFEQVRDKTPARPVSFE